MSTGTEEVYGGNEWTRGEVNRNRNTKRRNLSEVKVYRVLKVRRVI